MLSALVVLQNYLVRVVSLYLKLFIFLTLYFVLLFFILTQIIEKFIVIKKNTGIGREVIFVFL